MRSLRNFIVRIENPMKKSISCGDLDLIIDESVTIHNEFAFMNNWGEVFSVPEKWDIDCEVGDTIYFHHNVVMNKKNQQNSTGVQTNNFSLDEDKDLYFVPFEPKGRNNLVYVRIDKNGKIHTLGDVLLCAPIEEEKEHISENGLILNEDYNRRGLRLTCKVEYSNPISESKGIYAGDTVTLADSSDYEITIEGKKYWRIFDNDIYYRGNDYKKPYGSNICIQLQKSEDVISGIYIPNQDKVRSRYAKIISMDYEDSEIKVGDNVLIDNLSRMDVIDAKERMFYINKSNLLAVI